jgi:hypothetical protein
MCFAIATFHSTQNLVSSLAVRVVYLCILFGGILLSFVTELFQRQMQTFSLVLSLITSIEVLIEAVLFRAVYSPFVIVNLILFMIGWTSFIRLRFIFTVYLVVITIACYDVVALSCFPRGDSTLSSDNVV